jgi:Gas vesicle synthesis protein GvpL/GvpF
VIYVYAIGDAAALPPEPDGRGLGDARLEVLARDGLAAVLSRHPTLRPEPSPELLWAHEAVVERLMARATVLPLRFGTVLDGDDALAATLAERRDELAAGLERVRGRVELGVRVLGAPPPPRPREPSRPQSGRAYLMARRDAHHRAEREAAAVHAPLAAEAHDARLRAPAPPPAILSAAYLVDRGAVAAFRGRVGALAAARADVEIACTGPWPPYSFVPEGRP